MISRLRFLPKILKRNWNFPQFFVLIQVIRIFSLDSITYKFSTFCLLSFRGFFLWNWPSSPLFQLYCFSKKKKFDLQHILYTQGRRNRGGQGGLGLPNIFQQSESALFQQSCKHFYLAWHKVKSCFKCILSKIMIKFACSVIGKPFLAVLEGLKLKFSPGASAPIMVGPPTSLT